MSPTKAQKFKYFAYHDGYDPSNLRIGHLALDYANPEDHQPYYPEDINLFGNPAWATKDARTNCSMTYDNGKVLAFGIGSLNILDLGSSSSTNNVQTITGETGSMVELKEYVLTSSIAIGCIALTVRAPCPDRIHSSKMLC